MMLARNSADPAMSRSGLVFLGFKNCTNACAVTNTHHRHLHKTECSIKETGILTFRDLHILVPVCRSITGVHKSM